MSATVTGKTTLYLITSTRLRGVDTTFTWHETAPLEITLTLTTRTKTLEWVIGRDLLTTGLTEEVGDGDIRIAPSVNHPGNIEISLTSPGGHATLLANRENVEEFLAETWVYVLSDVELPLPQDDDIIAFMEGIYSSGETS